ncbi:MAG: PAS domain S-box-containing protein [Paracoccaceae bacterium]|jgi:PAS domain S-box-containing protein
MSILQQMLQPIWEISSEAIFITGDEAAPEDRRILYVNDAFTKLSGYSREHAIGQTPGMLHGPDSDPNVLGSSEEQLRTGKPHGYIQRHYRRDGSNDLCSVTRAALVDVDGSSRFLISMYKECPQNDSYAARGEIVDRNSVPLTIPMPLLEFPYGDLPEHLPSHPELDALLALWNEIRDLREVPDRADFTLDIMTRWASHLSIALVLPDGRFQFRLFGTELANV